MIPLSYFMNGEYLSIDTVNYVAELEQEIEKLNNDYLEMKDNFRTANDEIERLNKGYCQLKEKCNRGECDCTHEEYNGMCEQNMKMDLEIERLNNIIVKLKKVLWQRSEEARKNEQYVRLNCYKDILNELVNIIYEVDDETNE